MFQNQINYEKDRFLIDTQFAFKLSNLGFVFYDDEETNFARFTKIKDDYYVQIIFELKKRAKAKPDIPDPEEMNDEIFIKYMHKMRLTENINDQ